MATSPIVTSTMAGSSMENSSSTSSPLISTTTPTTTTVISSPYSFPNITHLVTIKLNDGNYLLWFTRCAPSSLVSITCATSTAPTHVQKLSPISRHGFVWTTLS